jgi:hypothetical protein
MSQDLSNVISQAVAAKLDRAFIEKEVETRIQKLVIEAVDQALRSYSEAGKLIQAAVTDALKVNKLDLPSYGETVTQMLEQIVRENVSELVAGKLAEDAKTLLGLAPKTYKLSELAEEMLDQNDDDGEITVIVDRNEHNSTWVYLDEQGGKDKYRCDYRMLISADGTIALAYLKETEAKSVKIIGRGWGIEQRIRALYACGTILELDEDYVQTSKRDY